jgi:hypothetical protein
MTTRMSYSKETNKMNSNYRSDELDKFFYNQTDDAKDVTIPPY